MFKPVSTMAMVALAMAGSAHAADPVEGDLLIRNVTVIDPGAETIRPGQDILIDEGRIVMIVGHDSEKFEAETTIEAAGHYVIPGLNDMHSHTSFAPIHMSSLKLMHANGVTGVREMGSDCFGGGPSLCLSAMFTSRDAIENGTLVGPRLLELSTAKLEQRMGHAKSEEELFYRPSSPEEAKAAVVYMQSRGAEIIKVSQAFAPSVFEALMEAANEAGIPVAGHIPMSISSAEVSHLGFRSIEHARDLPMDCAPVGAEIRDHLRRKFSGENLPWPDRSAVPGRSVAEFDPQLCAAQVNAMVEAGTYYVPTHLTREMDYRAVEQEYRDDPRLIYIPAVQQNFWNQDLDRTAQASPEMIEDLAAFYELGLKTTKIAFDAGVKIMVGTDANDTMVFPGFSVHDEIANLVEAGLTPMQALAAATSVPAEYFGRVDLGGVSEGKLADLVLLSANPLDDIVNTTSIEAVIQGGRVSDRAALDAMLDEVRAMAAQAGPPPSE